MDFKSGALVLLVVRGPLERDDGVQDVLAPAGAALATTFAGVMDKQRRDIVSAELENPLLYSGPGLGVVFAPAAV